jgi:SAM-dependent methyltransferase
MTGVNSPYRKYALFIRLCREEKAQTCVKWISHSLSPRASATPIKRSQNSARCTLRCPWICIPRLFLQIDNRGQNLFSAKLWDTIQSISMWTGVSMANGARSVEGSAPIQSQLWNARARDWAEAQESTVLPLYEEVLTMKDIGHGTKLLDVGCGSGMFCALAAKRGTNVYGLDASLALTDIAKCKIPQGDFRVGEMESLPYQEATFNVVTGFNSFQYAASPVDALREARRVAVQDALFIVAVWGRPQDCEATAYLSALGKLLPPPPPGAPGPFALSDDAVLRRLVSEAGMTPIEVKDVDCPWVYKDAETALRGLLSAGPAVKAIQTSGESHVRDAVLTALEPFRINSGGYRLENKFRYIVARS